MFTFLRTLLLFLIASTASAKDVSTEYYISDDQGRATSIVKGSMSAQKIIGKSLLDKVTTALKKMNYVQSIVVSKGEEIASEPSSWNQTITKTRNSQMFVTIRLGNRNVSMQFDVAEQNKVCGDASSVVDLDDDGESSCESYQSSSLEITGPTKLYGNFSTSPLGSVEALLLNAQTLSFEARKPYSNDENLKLESEFQMTDRFYLSNLKKFLSRYSLSDVMTEKTGGIFSAPVFLLASSRFLRQLNEHMIAAM